MFDSGFTFRARIRPGAAVSQDFSVYRWPEAAHPSRGKCPDDQVFEGRVIGDFFELCAPGYGVLGGGQYGNGRLHLRDINDMIIDEPDRARVVDHLRAVAQKRVDIAKAAYEKQEAALAAIG